ncbi:MAG: hypothetical protein ABSG87_07700 [Verrucomicrobiota bacterium]|jgi:hypothetical protein
MPASERPLNRDRAWACVMQNLATPGIGSLKARRVFAGVCQLLLALAGCFLVCAWVVGWSYRIYQAQLGESVSQDSVDWLWSWGLIFFGVSWLWSLVTSASLLWQARREDVPPKLADLTKPEL